MRKIICSTFFFPSIIGSTLLCVVRFAEVAEAEVVEGDLGEEADSVEIRTEDYNSKGEKM